MFLDNIRNNLWDVGNAVKVAVPTDENALEARECIRLLLDIAVGLITHDRSSEFLVRIPAQLQKSLETATEELAQLWKIIVASGNPGRWFLVPRLRRRVDQLTISLVLQFIVLEEIISGLVTLTTATKRDYSSYFTDPFTKTFWGALFGPRVIYYYTSEIISCSSFWPNGASSCKDCESFYRKMSPTKMRQFSRRS